MQEDWPPKLWKRRSGRQKASMKTHTNYRLFAALALSLVPLSAALPRLLADSPAPSLGLTQAQVMAGPFKDEFPLKDATPVKGQPRRMGDYREMAIELIGPPSNLTQVTFLAGAPSDGERSKVEIRHVYVFVGNCFPDWSDYDKWLTTALKEVIDKGNGASKSITVGSKRLKVDNALPLGILVVVKHA
jgi:hypothetical protein